MNVVKTESGLLKMWTYRVPVENAAVEQLVSVANMPFVAPYVAVMPDVHAGMGATIGSVIPMNGCIMPAAVGVDIGCGMRAVKINIDPSDIRRIAGEIREMIEAYVPHGRTNNGGIGDKGAWKDIPYDIDEAWGHLASGFDEIVSETPQLARSNNKAHLGTLGTGNHFVEICEDETGEGSWIVVHSGSRGIGAKIGGQFIKEAKVMCSQMHVSLTDPNLAYFPAMSETGKRYVKASYWALGFAKENRRLIANATKMALEEFFDVVFDTDVIDCHHNYLEGSLDRFIARKGAISARSGQRGIIPGSMGAKSFIVSGLGNAQSFESCSHGAGRAMSRTQARKTFTVHDHEKATEGVACRKDETVLDETPGAYKDIDAVMAAQSDLVEVVHTLKQIVCVKG